MYLLDTDVVSETRKIGSPRVDPGVAKWAAGLAAETLYLSVITIHEIELGVLLMTRRDPAQGARLRAWLDGQVLATFDGRVLPVSVEVARRSAALHVPDPKPVRDSFIAATALVHGLTVATRNTRDFASSGVALVNPWETV